MFLLIIMTFLIINTIIIILISNKIKTLRIKVEEAKADLEVYLIQRYEILTESSKIAKKYMEHETDLMLNITKIRKGMTINETAQIINEQNNSFEKFLATAESYPQLYSSEIFRTLQLQITDTNEHLTASKRMYNSNVSIFNQYIVMFPINLIANLIKEQKIEFLEDKSIENKKDVKLNL